MHIHSCVSYTKTTLEWRGHLRSVQSPMLMGILNITPDSFYDGGRYNKDKEKISKHVRSMLKAGASMLDIGAYSSRPGATHISEKEETERLSFALETLKNECPEIQNTMVSIDTFRSGIIKTLDASFSIDFVNDISAGAMDTKMAETVANLKLGYIAMHMQGTPSTMQNATHYEHLLVDILKHLGKRIANLKQLGVKDILVDPGIGFGKTLEQNFDLLEHLPLFKLLELPLLIGISRKSLICKTLNILPEEALHGTGALHMLALEKGANILRVHDVSEAQQVIRLWQKLHTNEQSGITTQCP